MYSKPAIIVGGSTMLAGMLIGFPSFANVLSLVRSTTQR